MPAPNTDEEQVFKLKLGLDVSMSDSLHSALVDYLKSLPRGSFLTNNLTLVSVRESDKWALMSIEPELVFSTSTDDLIFHHSDYRDSQSLLLIAHELDSSKWQFALQDTGDFTKLVQLSPGSFLQEHAKADLSNTSIYVSELENIVNYKFPWVSGKSWLLTPARPIIWHTDHPKGLDFLVSSTGDRRVLLAASGTVVYIKPCQYSVNVKVKDDAGIELLYMHTDRVGFNFNNVKLGEYLPQGYVIGSVRPETWRDNCGRTEQTGWAHIHWSFPKNSKLLVDGCIIEYEVNYLKCGSEDKSFGKLFLSSNQPIDRLPGDAAPPITHITLNGSENQSSGQETYKFPLNIALRADDLSGDNTPSGVRSINYRIGEGTWQQGNSFSINTHGSYSIEYFAVDNAGNQESIHRISVKVDARPPTSIFNQKVNLSNWFNNSVQMEIGAFDDNEANTTTSVAKLSYRIDGGDLRETSDNPVKLSTIPGDGIHTIEYYATDKVGNEETPHNSISIKIDATPPSAPGMPTTPGVTSGVWQKNFNTPTFTWAASNDGSGSGIQGYPYEWNGVVNDCDSKGCSYPTTTRYDPGMQGTGSYTFRLKAKDLAGNYSTYSPPFIFNYDGDPPSPPAVENLDNVANGVWQNRIRTANFSWPVAEDAGSGVQKYYVYAGNDPNGTNAAPTTNRSYLNPTPFVAADGAATFYLRTRSEDGVGLQSDWNSYAIRYDGAPPTVTLNVNYGLPVAHSTNVNLNVATNDVGSGVDQMRFSVEGGNWSEWQSATINIPWQIPGVGKRSYDIYAQVKDRAGNLSAIVSDTVTLNVNAPFPQSANYFLWNGEFVGGSTDNNGGILTSPSWKQRVTLGLNFGATTDTTNRSSSNNYRLNGGLQAAALSIPTATITSTPYLLLISNTLSSGVSGGSGLISSNWKMDGTLGQATNMQTSRSSNFAATLGYWGAVAMITDTVPPPPPPVTSTTPIDCEFYGLSVNNAALFTNSSGVGLNLCGPNPTEIMLSNDGGFVNAVWQPYTRTVPWSITTYGAYVLPRTVYARYRDAQGQIFGPIQDDIIYDPTPPSGRSSFNIASLFVPATADTNQLTAAEATEKQEANAVRTVNSPIQELYLLAGDDASGLNEMQVSFAADFANATWQPFAGIVPITLSEDGRQTVYTRFRDKAGNVSSATTTAIIRDTTPPSGTVTMTPPIVNDHAITVSLQFSATDAVSGVSLVRASRFATFSDTVWLPYTPDLVFNLNDDGAVTPIVYAQFRDAAGNESEVSQFNYQVDSIAPTASISVTDFSESMITLAFNAEDDLSGLKEVWLSFDYEFITGVVKLNYVPTLEWDMQGYGVVNMRFVDNAGNISEDYWWGGSDGPIDDVPEEIESRVYLPVISR